MPHLQILLRDGKRRTVQIPAGGTLATILRQYKTMASASRYGIEKQASNGWEKVPLSYVVKAEDVLRVATPEQTQTGTALGRLLLNVVQMIKPRKKREGTGNRRRRN